MVSESFALSQLSSNGSYCEEFGNEAVVRLINSRLLFLMNWQILSLEYSVASRESS